MFIVAPGVRDQAELYTCYLTAIFEPDNHSCHLLFTLKLYVCSTLLFKIVDKREVVKPPVRDHLKCQVLVVVCNWRWAFTRAYILGHNFASLV